MDTSTSPLDRSRSFHLVFTGIVLLANLIALAAAWQDRSWGALGIAVVVGPSMNGVLSLLSLLATPALQRTFGPFSVGKHVAISLLLPGAAICLDALAISLVDRREEALEGRRERRRIAAIDPIKLVGPLDAAGGEVGLEAPEVGELFGTLEHDIAVRELRGARVHLRLEHSMHLVLGGDVADERGEHFFAAERHACERELGGERGPVGVIRRVPRPQPRA